jgi:hypothetical protein
MHRNENWTYFGGLYDKKNRGWDGIDYSQGWLIQGLILSRSKRFCSHPKHSDWFWGPPTSPVQWVLWFFPWDMMLTICLHLELKLRMSGAIPSLPYRPLWHGEVQLHLFYLLCDETIVSTHNHCTDVQWDSLSSPAHTVVFVLNWKALECM